MVPQNDVRSILPPKSASASILEEEEEEEESFKDKPKSAKSSRKLAYNIILK